VEAELARSEEEIRRGLVELDREGTE
jgi:hypothetical protein